MGLPGAGKTTLAVALKTTLESIGRTVDHYNADIVREQYNDWDFSDEGRIRQSQRMRDLADASTSDYVIADFIAPLPEQRKQYNAKYLIWINTEVESRYPDTDAIFVPPTYANFFVDTKDADVWASKITKHLLHLEKYGFN